MFERVLVPLDGSSLALCALKYATEVAQRFEAECILMQVVKPATPVIAAGPSGVAAYPAGSEITALEEDKRNIASANRYLSRKARGIKSQDMPVSYVVIVGDPAQSIMTFAKKEHIDLIVMSTHGKSGLKRAIIGSVADEVIREPGIPVLAIRPKRQQTKK